MSTIVEFAPGMRIGEDDRYEIIRICGRGGMGIVYEAVDFGLDTPVKVAIKQLLPVIASNPRFVENVKREVNIARKLGHPNIVGVYEYLFWGTDHLVIMEWMEGKTIDEDLFEQAEKKYTLDRALEIIKPVADALNYAHTRIPPVAHRDVKPLNMMFNAQGEVKLTDFGISREIKESLTRLTGKESSGSLEYAPYEQSMGEKPHPSHDIYALGISLYEFLNGEPPFARGDIVRQHLEKPPPPIEGVPEPVMEVILKALAKDPGERFQSAGALMEALENAVKLARLPLCPVCGNNPEVERFACPRCLQENICLNHRDDEGLCPDCAYEIAQERKRRAEEERRRKEEEERKRILEEKRRQEEEKRKREEEERIRLEQEETERQRLEEEKIRAEEKRRKKEAEERKRREEEEKLENQAKAKRKARNIYIIFAICFVVIIIFVKIVSNDGKKEEYQSSSQTPSQADELYQKNTQIRNLLTIAKRQFNENKLTKPDGDNAYETYKKVLNLDRYNTEAKNGIQKIADTYEAWGDGKKTSGNWKEAVSYYEKAIKVGGSDASISQKKEYCQNQIGTTPAGPPAGLEFVLIPGGSFMMGSPSSEEGRDDDEGPQHRVAIQPFYMMTTEVTQLMWQEVMGSNPSNFKGDNLPVERVSWNDCQEFIRKLNLRDPGKGYRLPTEAEWEYACRAGTTTPFNTGSTISTDEANYDGNYTYGNGYKGVYRNKTTPVKSFSPNRWGLYDMHGNVWEWCEDRWHDSYAGAPADGSAWVSGSSDSRVLRGGSWRYNPELCRSANRNWNEAMAHIIDMGLRVVRSL